MMGHNWACLLLPFVLLISCRDAWCKVKFPIGAIVLPGEEPIVHAVNYALQKFKSPLFEPELVTENLDWVDYIQLNRKVCLLFKRRIYALLSPKDARLQETLASFSNNYQMPLISPELGQSSTQNAALFGVSMKLRTINATGQLIRFFDWPSFIYLYDSDQGPHHLENLLKATGPAVKVRSLKRVSNALEGLQYLSQQGNEDPDNIQYVVLDTSLAVARSIISRHARELRSMKNVLTHFIVANSMTDDFWQFRPIDLVHVNVTAFRLLDSDYPPAKDFHRGFRSTKSPRIDPKVPVEAYLMHDGAVALLKSVSDLLSNNPNIFQGSFNGSQGLNCLSTQQESFQHGPLIAQYLKEVSVSDGLTGPIRFDINGERRSFSQDIVTATSKGHEKIGSWSDQNGLNMIQVPVALAQLQRDNSRDFPKNSTLTVLSMLVKPYLIQKEDSDNEYEGFIPDLLAMLERQLPFQFEIRVPKHRRYGTMNAEGHWNGMIGELIKKEADLIATDLIMTSKRVTVLDFTLPFLSDSLAVLKKPDAHSSRSPGTSGYFFLHIFSRDLWLAIICALVGFTIVSFLLNRLIGGPDRVRPRQHPHQSTLCSSFFMSFGSLFLQSTGMYPRSVSARTLSCVWWFCVLVLIIVYIANMSVMLLFNSLLSAREQISPEQFFQEAADGRRTIGVLSSGNVHAFLKDSTDTLIVNAYERNNILPDFRVVNYTDGLKQVQDYDDYGFLGYYSTLKMLGNEVCGLETVKLIPDLWWYGIALPKGSQLTNVFNGALLSLKESGKLDRLAKKWLTDGNNACSRKQQFSTTQGYRRLMLQDISGVFHLLLAGFLVAIVVGAIEFCLSARRESRKTNVSIQKVMWSRAQSSLRRSSKEVNNQRPEEEHALQTQNH